jgi:hypothetical protein
MPGFLLHSGATVICAHAGQAQATLPNPRVKVSGQPIVTQSCLYTIAGCPFTVGTTPVPCVTGQWVTAAMRVKAGGEPVLLQDSQSVCTPNGTPMNIIVTQTRARGS